MRHRLRSFALGAFALGVAALAPPGAAPAQTQLNDPAKIPLRVVPLESPNLVVSKSDANSPSARLYNGMMLPTTPLEFLLSSECGMNVGGAKVVLKPSGKGFTAKIDDKPVQLKSSGNGYAAIRFKTASGRDYILAFPIGSTSLFSSVLYLRSGGALQGNAGGEVLSIFDDNTDGRYRLGEDTVRLTPPDASVSLFAPASKFIAGAKQLRELKSIAEDGSSVECAPYAGPIGRLALTCNAADMEIQAVIGSKQTQVNGVLVASSSNAGELTVIPGSYEIVYGGVYSTKSNSLVAILAPGSLPAIKVDAGSAAAVQLGGPLAMEFTVNRAGGDKIAIDSGTFHVRGKAGEEYRLFEWNQSVPIDVSAQRGSTVVQLGKMSFG